MKLRIHPLPSIARLDLQLRSPNDMSLNTRFPRSPNFDHDFDDVPGELLHNAAQASRLRRRGAIRTGRPDLFPFGSHPLGRDNPDCILVGALRRANDRRGVRWVICGGPEDEASDSEGVDDTIATASEASFNRPSPLPSIIDLRPQRPRSVGRLAPRKSATRCRKGNGCGTILHYSALSVPRMRSCAALIDPEDDAAIGTLPESTHPVPRSKAMCKCARERVGCLRWCVASHAPALVC